MALADEFHDSGGYEFLTELLVTGPFEGRYLDAKQFIISALENLVFIGPEISKDELLSLAGVDDEMGEPISSLNGPSIRNHHALVPLLFCLLHPNNQHVPIKLYPGLSSRIAREPLPNSFREAILTALVNLASIHPLNYLVINGHKVTLKLLEEFNTISFVMRVIDIL
ncbi:beige protein-like 1 [Entomophthora muscae]|uniref:Beige protein-like 1 n=1 Tax=Entomophthora muscae TaxID=34485 RepID=A0ACC2TYI6_9FUNG|nr:beige protein-like 1 [Entomophthora muscae]